MTKLKTYKFNDLYSMSSGISSKPEQAGHGSPFLSFSIVFNNYFLPEKLDDLMDTSESEQDTYSILKGDIFLTRTSEVVDELGMSSVALKDYPKATYSGFLKRLRPMQNNITYDKYMAFYLRSQLFRKTMTNNAVMTLRASLNENIFSYLDLILPDFKEQFKIGELLYLINSKIELNNRINAELENLAKTIYDYWFVQFDFPFDFAQGKPDRNGKPYKSSGGEMVYNKECDRAIPAGWKIGKLGDIGENIRNGIKESDINPEMSYIGLEHIPRKKIALDSWSKATDLASNKFLFVSGNILFGKLRPYFHKVGVAFISGVCSTDILILDSKQKTDFGYFLMIVSSDDFIHYVTLATEGTRMPRTNWEHMQNYLIPIPENIIAERFNDVLTPLISQMKNNVLQNQQLTQLRDWLLPMLMNGQISIK